MSQEDGGFVEWWYDRDSWKSGFKPVKLTTEEKNKIAALCLMEKHVHLPCGSYWYVYDRSKQMFCLMEYNKAPKYIALKTDHSDPDIA